MQHIMNEMEDENQTLQDRLDQNIISMLQMTLEFQVDETVAIRKMAEKCNRSEDDIIKLWNSYKKNK